MRTIDVDLVIIGAGTAGLSAFKEARKITSNIVIIDAGPLGTTCARVGCMPSKVLMQIAEYYYDRRLLKKYGIHGAKNLTLNIPEALRYLRNMRDSFTQSNINVVKQIKQHLVIGQAIFLDQHTLRVGNKLYRTKATIIATGDTSIIPAEWQDFSDRILTNENLFEQRDFPKKIAVIGAGAIGIEFGQALSRFGISIELFNTDSFIARLSDPVVNEYAINLFQQEFSLYLNQKAIITPKRKNLHIETQNHSFLAKQIIVALGQKPNLESLNLEQVLKNNTLKYDRCTMKINNLPIYLAGDVGKIMPTVHEATLDGKIAGYNATHFEPKPFKHYVPLMIIFSVPTIAIIGQSFNELLNQPINIGEVYFDDQGRSKVMQKNKGVIRIYSDKQGKLLGSELIAPGGEHLAHLLAWAIQQNLSVKEVLNLPFYHPTLEEGLCNALRNLKKQV